LVVWPWSCSWFNTFGIALRAPDLGLSLGLDTDGLGFGHSLGAYGLVLDLSLVTFALTLGNLILITSLVITTLKLHDIMQLSFHLL